MIRSLLALSALWCLLAACATTPSSFEQGTAAGRAGDFATAETLLRRSINNNESVPESWNNLANVYFLTNRKPQAIQALTVAARYGLSRAQTRLVSLNQPVPPADLVNKRVGPSGSEALAQILNAGVQGWNQGMANAAAQPPQVFAPIASPQRTNCDSTQTAPGQFTTTCATK